MRSTINSTTAALLAAMFVLALQSEVRAADDRSVDWIAGNRWKPLVERLQSDGFDDATLRRLFLDSGLRYDPAPMRTKMRSLYKIMFGRKRVANIQAGLTMLGFQPGPVDGVFGQWTSRAIKSFQASMGFPVDGLPRYDVLKAVCNRAPSPDLLPYPPSGGASRGVYGGVLNAMRLREAESFCRSNEDLLNEAEERFGVPREIAAGILTVETRIGKNLGGRSALRTLAGMSLCADFSLVSPFFVDKKLTLEQAVWLNEASKRKAQWAYDELKALITYADANGLDALSMKGSIYGAIGISQFMPSNAVKYGVDGQGDGVVNLFDMPDAVHSLCNYVRAHGWKSDSLSREEQRKVIYQYNHSQRYVNTVLAVADHLAAETER